MKGYVCTCARIRIGRMHVYLNMGGMKRTNKDKIGDRVASVGIGQTGEDTHIQMAQTSDK